MHPNADHLPHIRHQHQLVVINHRKGCHDFAITLTGLNIGNPLPATSRAPVIIGRRALAIAIFSHRQDKLIGVIADH